MLPNQRRNGKENKKKTYYKIHSESDNRKKIQLLKNCVQSIVLINDL